MTDVSAYVLADRVHRVLKTRPHPQDGSNRKGCGRLIILVGSFLTIQEGDLIR